MQAGASLTQQGRSNAASKGAAMPYMRYIVALPLLFLFLAAPQSAQADAPFSGHVVVARASDDALLLWDATSDVTRIAAAHWTSPDLVDTPLSLSKTGVGVFCAKQATTIYT
jgi:hypothetical protein